jgi:hypothetical protein
MFEKIGNLAERLATHASLSRRGFFGWATRGALAVAGALALGSVAEAGPGNRACCKKGGRCSRRDEVCSGTDPKTCRCVGVRR